MINGYKEILPGEYDIPKANGMVYEHRSVAANKLQRTLLKTEVVHHIDEDRSNNDPDNLMVFRSKSDHTAHHAGAPLVNNGDGTYSSAMIEKVYLFPKTKSTKKVFYAICKCGYPKSIEASQCLDCFNKDKSKHIPSRQELETLIWQYPMTHLAEMFGVSDKAISKWIAKYNLDKPPRGYFLRK